MEVWEIDGEDLIVAKSKRHMHAIYQDYHGESTRGHLLRLIPSDAELTLTDGFEEEYKIFAGEFAKSRSAGYFPAWR